MNEQLKKALSSLTQEQLLALSNKARSMGISEVQIQQGIQFINSLKK